MDNPSPHKKRRRIMKFEKKEVASICKLVESGINLIVAGGLKKIVFNTPISVPDEHTGWFRLYAAEITLEAVTDWSNTPQYVVINIGGAESQVEVVAEDGEMHWTPLTPLSDRVEKAVGVIFNSAEL